MDVLALFLLALALFFLIPIFVLIVLSRLKPKRQYGVASVTLRGERVKSVGERKIADYFEENNIRYVYEQEARRKGLFLDYRIGIPDFYLPDYNVYVEYWGLVNTDDYGTRTRYVRNMKRKMAIYHRSNMKFISIYPDNLENLDWIFRRKFRRVTGFELNNSQSRA